MRLLSSTALAAVVIGIAAPAYAQSDAATSQGSQQNAAMSPACDASFKNVDVDNDGMVTREEAVRGVQQDFGIIDADGNGEITKEEFANCTTPGNEQQAATGDRTDENFAGADVNQDQSVDRNEYMASAQKAYEDADRSNDAARPTWFLWLTPQELEQGAADKMSPDVAGTRAAMNFAALDENGDGKLTAAEWKRDSVSGMTPDWSASRFSYLDADGSGTVSKDEYSTAQFSALDQTKTSAMPSADASGSDAKTQSASDADGQTMSDQSIPVFIYRFRTF